MCVYHLLELELDKEKKQSRWTKLKGKKKILLIFLFPPHINAPFYGILLWYFSFLLQYFHFSMNQRWSKRFLNKKSMNHIKQKKTENKSIKKRKQMKTFCPQCFHRLYLY